MGIKAAMENWRAGLIGVGIVLIGLGGYSSLDGVWKGLSLVAAGIALVLLGLSLERTPHAASVGAGEAEVRAEADTSVDDIDVTVPMAAVAVAEAESTVPIARASSAADAEVEPEPEPAGSVEPEPGAGRAEQPARSEPPPLASKVEAADDPAPAVQEDALAADDGSVHRHEQPMLGHSELVSHIRDYHEGVPFDGSTIQLRLLHERAHAD